MNDSESLFKNESMASDYANHRPVYSDELFQVIVDYCKETSQDLDLAIDVGCGPGSSTVGLTKHFKKVIGVDISEAQIALAPRGIPNCEFKVGAGESMAYIQDESVDLYSAGLALYLMNQKEAFAEADRILKPGGTMANFGYGFPRCTDPVMDNIIHQACITMGCSRMPDQFKEISTLWKNTATLPYSNCERRNGPVLRQRTTLMRGIWVHFSFIQNVLNRWGSAEGNGEQFIAEVKQMLAEKMPDLDPNQEFDLLYDTYILLARKPLP